MARRALPWTFVIALTACGDPAPIVLGHLQARAEDAGPQSEVDAAREREPEGGSEAGEQSSEREEPSERE